MNAGQVRVLAPLVSQIFVAAGALTVLSTQFLVFVFVLLLSSSKGVSACNTVVVYSGTNSYAVTNQTGTYIALYWPNTESPNPCANRFTNQNDTILVKIAGLYRIEGFVTITNANYFAQAILFHNGNNMTFGSWESVGVVSVQFTTVRHLGPNTRLQFGVGAYFYGNPISPPFRVEMTFRTFIITLLSDGDS
jgi:hypothetical protein